MKSLVFFIFLILISINAYADNKAELILAIERQGTEVVISKLTAKTLNEDFQTYIVKIEDSNAKADLSSTNAFVLENPNRFVIDIPSDKSFTDESIFLADSNLALLRFGRHANKKRVVIDFENTNVFSLDKNVNSNNSISYMFNVNSSGTTQKNNLKKDNNIEFDSAKNKLDIPSVEELESYLTPQAGRYLDRIKAKESKKVEVAKKLNENVEILEDPKKIKEDYSRIEENISNLINEKEQSYNYFYGILAFLLISIFWHRSRTVNRKSSYKNALKNLKQYSPEVSYGKRSIINTEVQINSLGALSTTLGKANNTAKSETSKSETSKSETSKSKTSKSKTSKSKTSKSKTSKSKTKSMKVVNKKIEKGVDSLI